MKRILLIATAMLISGLLSHVLAQDCTPDAAVVDTAEPGQISPAELPPATQGEYYDETITIIPPDSFEGMDIIYSIIIDSITGLPDGINWYKNEEEFLVTEPDTRYCVNLYGTPTEQGLYPLTLYITPYVEFMGSVVSTPQQVDDTSMSIFVDAPVIIEDLNTLTRCEAFPNPFKSQTEIHFHANETGEAELKVYNLLGKLMYRETISANVGENQFMFDGRKLLAGSYIYSIRLNEKTNTSRLLKSE